MGTKRRLFVLPLLASGMTLCGSPPCPRGHNFQSHYPARLGHVAPATDLVRLHFLVHASKSNRSVFVFAISMGLRLVPDMYQACIRGEIGLFSRRPRPALE